MSQQRAFSQARGRMKTVLKLDTDDRDSHKTSYDSYCFVFTNSKNVNTKYLTACGIRQQHSLGYHVLNLRTRVLTPNKPL